MAYFVLCRRFPRRRQESTGRATVVVDLTESDDGEST
jgi:hypothetical protein